MTVRNRRLSHERDIWQAVWKQVETFLDRIDSAASDDEPHAKTMCALFPVFNVIERARQRSMGYRLASALSATPRGRKTNGDAIGSVDAGTLTSGGRIPGVEDCEFAVAGYAVNDDGEIDDPPRSIMTRSVALASFRDEKHGEVVLRSPSYDFGDLSGVPMVVITVGDHGLFPRDAREDAMNGGEAKFKAWKSLRDERVGAAMASGGESAISLSQRLSEVMDTSPLDVAGLIDIGAKARSAASEARQDQITLEQSKAALDEAGVDSSVIAAMAAAASTMQQQSLEFDVVADELTPERAGGQGYNGLVALRDRLVVAQGAPGISGLPFAIEQLDAAAAAAMNEAVEHRIGYPDGPLRQLRLLEWSLRFFWEHRTHWMKWRNNLILSRLYSDYLRGFTQSLERVLEGQPSGLGLPSNTLVGKQVLVGATEIPLSNIPDLSTLTPGQIVIVGGERPAAAPVVDVLFDGRKLPPMRLKVPSLVVSVAHGKAVPGTPGIVKVGTRLGSQHRALDDSELRRGRYRDGEAGDGYVQSLVAYRSRLALLLGDGGGGSDPRPAPPAIARPYPGMHRFDLEGTVKPSDTRLFLKTLPPKSASGTGEPLGLAGPGELLLLYGRDGDGVAWQTAVEVERSLVTRGDEARREEAAGATAVPPCCADDEWVLIVYVRSMQFPNELSEAFLHRSFAGFGAPSLMTGVVLPEALDPSTSSTVQVGSQTLRPRRDPELRAAVRVFDELMPKETQ